MTTEQEPKVIDVLLNKESIERGDNVICQNNVGVVTDVRYNDADEVEVHWLTTKYKAARTSIDTLRAAYRLSAASPSPEGGGEDDWISVKDSLPDFDVKVLVWGEAKGMNPQMGGAYPFVTYRRDFSKTKHQREYDRMVDENKFYAAYVTHWKYIKKPKI